MSAQSDARELRALIEEIAQRVARIESSQRVSRVVTAVQDPTVTGRGGSCTVVDGRGLESFGIRWFEHRPDVGDVVLVEVPPVGGTRRVVAIDREL